MRTLGLALLLLGACHGGGLSLDSDAGLGCAQLTTQADCVAHDGCVADTCLECSCAPIFVGCREKSAPTTACPALECVSFTCCRADSDCPLNLPGICSALPASANCGICDPTATSTCETDGDCAAMNEICNPMPCSCGSQPVMTCQPGCSSDDDCPEPQACGPDKRCEARPCDSQCSGNYTCGSDNICTRKTCKSDGDCATPGYCVDGQCSRTLGECIAPAA